MSKQLFVFLFLIFNFISLPLISSQCPDATDEVISYILSQMTLEEKCSLLHGSSMFQTPGLPRLGIPGFTMSDGPHGVLFGTNVTAFPITTALTGTWDPEFMEIVGQAYGREFRGSGKDIALGPSIDIGRDPRNGRASETIGEEPYLGGKVFAAFVRGAQSTHLITCAKVLLGQNHDADRNHTGPLMDKRTMREFHGLAFRLVVQEGGVYSIMSAYNLVNNVHCSQNDDILNKMLKEEWGYEYFVVSDWWGTYDTPSVLINSGLDMEMPEKLYFNWLAYAVYVGEVSPDKVDNAVRRTLRARFKAGYMDPKTPKGNPADVNSEENQKINREAARKVITLLKNQDNILPLQKSGSVALIGPNANDIPLTSFGSSNIPSPAYKVSTRQGIANIAPAVKVTYEKGCDINSSDKSGFEAAIAAAKDSNVVIFVGGLDQTQEGESFAERAGMDRTGGSVMLPSIQRELIQQLSAVNPNIIVVLHSGGIVSVGSTLDNIKGLIYAWYCGSEGGNAIAEVIFGDVNPGAKLPIAMPVDDTQLPDWNNLDFTNDMISGYGYRRYDNSGEKPLFNFGFGLSYTTFEYKNIKVCKSKISGNEEIAVSVDITNTGNRDGDEVAQLYLSYDKLSVPMPKKQLRGFKRVHILKGETKTVEFKLTSYELCYWSTVHDHYFVEKGEYFANVGGSSDDLKLKIGFLVENDYIIPYGNQK